MLRCLVDPCADPSRPKLVCPRPRVSQVVLRSLVLLRHRYHDLRHLRLEDLVQPGALRPFLEAKMNGSRDPTNRLQQRVAVRLHHLEVSRLPVGPMTASVHVSACASSPTYRSMPVLLSGG